MDFMTWDTSYFKDAVSHPSNLIAYEIDSNGEVKHLRHNLVMLLSAFLQFILHLVQEQAEIDPDDPFQPFQLDNW